MTKLPEGNEVLDLNHPYKGKEEVLLDAFAKYAFRAISFLGRKARANVQLNVRNLLNEDAYLVTQTMTNGSPKIYRYQSPRR